MNFFWRALVTTFCFICMPSISHSAQDKAHHCLAITDNAKRLECFDTVLNDQQKNASNKEKTNPLPDKNNKNGRWFQITNESLQLAIATKALEFIQTRKLTEITPVLVLRCADNNTSAFIGFGGLHITDSQEHGNVTFRIDQKQTFVEKLTTGGNDWALGFWTDKTAIPFIKSLLGASTLQVKLTPENESELIFSFDIANLPEFVQPLRQECQW